MEVNKTRPFMWRRNYVDRMKQSGVVSVFSDISECPVTRMSNRFAKVSNLEGFYSELSKKYQQDKKKNKQGTVR